MPSRSLMLRFLGNEIEALIFAVLFSLVLAAVIAVIILRRRGLYFSLLTLAFSQIAFEIAYQMDRPHRRRERAAGRAAPAAGDRLAIPRVRRRHRRHRHGAAVAHRARAVRPRAAGAARQRAAGAQPRLQHVPHQVRGVRHHGRRGRLRRRAAGAACCTAPMPTIWAGSTPAMRC